MFQRVCVNWCLVNMSLVVRLTVRRLVRRLLCHRPLTEFERSKESRDPKNLG